MERLQALQQAEQLEAQLNAIKMRNQVKLIRMTQFLAQNDIGIHEYLTLCDMKKAQIQKAE